MSVGRLGRRDDLILRRIRPSVGDVLRHGRAEEDRLLEDHANRAAQSAQVEVAHVDAVDAHPAGICIIEARDEMDQRALARAGLAQHGHSLTRFGDEGNFLQRRPAAGRVLERNRLEGNLYACSHLGRERPRAARHLQRLLEHFHHPLGAGAGVLDDVHELADRLHARADAHEIADNHREVAHGHLAGNHLHADDPEHQRHAQSKNELRHRHAAGPVVDRVERRFDEGIAPVPELGDLVRLARKGFHHAHAGDVFLDHGGQFAVQVVDLAPFRIQLPRVKDDQADRRPERAKRGDPGRQADAGDQDEAHGHRDGDVDAEEKAGEEKFLQA